MSENIIQGTHIRFNLLGSSKSGKTRVWAVVTNGGLPLGEIKWFSRWRKYCLFPDPVTIFEETCLREIAQFVVDRTKEHRTHNVVDHQGTHERHKV